MATIKDVAKAAGVSIASVSAVLNGSGRVGEGARGRIANAIEAVGYAPNTIARSLRLGHSHLIGMVVGDITNPFSGALVRTVEKVAIANGFSVIVSNADGDETRVPEIIDQLRGQHVAGIILNPMSRSDALVKQIESRPLPPVVTMDQKLPGLACDYVGIDNRAAIRMLVEYLVRLGHTRIALLSGRVGRWTADERYEGFVAAMADAGLVVDPSLVARAGYEGESGYEAAGAMMTRQDRPSAIVAANNIIALGALQSCLDLGFQCPADISLAGMDDVPWSGLVRPKLSIVGQPIADMGELAISWLLERIRAPDGAIAPRERIFRPFFAAGDSCRDIRPASPPSPPPPSSRPLSPRPISSRRRAMAQ